MNLKNSMNTVVLCLSCLLFHFNSTSQTSTQIGKKKVLKVSMNTDAGHIKGYIYNVTDTSVTISQDIAYNDSISANDTRLKTFNYYNINSVSRVRKGSILIGALAGAVTGAILGSATYQEPEINAGYVNRGVAAFAGGIVWTPVGILVGAIVRKKKFRINKDINRFQRFKSNVLRKVNR